VRNLHKLESLTPYTNDLNQNWGKEGVETHTRTQSQQEHAHKSRRERKNQSSRLTAQKRAKSLSNETIAWSQSLGVVVCSRSACVQLHAPRGSFYSPKGPRSCLVFIWKALVVFCPWVHWTVRFTPDTAQSSIPFLNQSRRPLPVVGHLTHRTVQCNLVTIG
jgi:predicted DNA-binding WGR domain protein